MNAVPVSRIYLHVVSVGLLLCLRRYEKVPYYLNAQYYVSENHTLQYLAETTSIKKKGAHCTKVTTNHILNESCLLDAAHSTT